MIRVPRRIIWQLDQQIEKQRQRVVEAQRHLDEMVQARSEMEPMDSSHGNAGRKRGGIARAEALSPDRRSQIAQDAANKRWQK